MKTIIKLSVITGRESLTIIIPKKKIENLVEIGNCNFVNCIVENNQLIFEMEENFD